MSALRTISLAAVLLATAGCGGGNGPADDAVKGGGHLTRNATKSCLEGAGIPVKNYENHFATGSEGGLIADFESYDVFLAFGKDDKEAKSLAAGVVAMNKALSGGLDRSDTVKSTGNVSYYVNAVKFPSDSQKKIADCLK